MQGVGPIGKLHGIDVIGDDKAEIEEDMRGIHRLAGPLPMGPRQQMMNLSRAIREYRIYDDSAYICWLF